MKYDALVMVNNQNREARKKWKKEKLRTESRNLQERLDYQNDGQGKT